MAIAVDAGVRQQSKETNFITGALEGLGKLEGRLGAWEEGHLCSGICSRRERKLWGFREQGE